MNAYGPLFDICQRKHGGNPQSVQANKMATKYKLGARQRILEILRQYWGIEDGRGMTCEELERKIGLSHQTCSARISELKREGKIKQVGTRKISSGCQAAVYTAT